MIWRSKRNLMCVVLIGLIGSFFSYISVELSRFLTAICEKECNGCDRILTCFARKKIAWRDSDYLNEWMLVSYLKVRKKCQYYFQCSIWEKIICFTLTFFCFLYPLWSEGFKLEGIIYGMVAIALLFLSVVDWNTQYIPLECSVLVFVCGLLHVFMDLSNWLDYVIGLIAVSGFLLLVNWIATPILRKMYAGELELDAVIGDGDIKLMAATGLLLGWKLNFIALGIGCITGSVIHLILMKIKGSERQFALGPYLSLGVYITMICGEQLISWYLNVMGVTPY